MTIDLYDDLAIEHKLLCRNVLKGLDHLREVTPERLTSFRLQQHLLSFAERQAAEAVPFRLVEPAFVLRNLFDRLRLHRRKWRSDGQRDSRKWRLQIFRRYSSFRNFFLRSHNQWDTRCAWRAARASSGVEPT